MIPAYNEEANIEKTILSIPRRIVGVDEVKILVVNDGSQDNTVEMAMNGCADKIVSHKKNSGVGSAFMTGVRNAILMNADMMVTVDADSQNKISYDPKSKTFLKGLGFTSNEMKYLLSSINT